MSYSDGMDVIVGAFPPIARGARSSLSGKRPYSLSVSGHGGPGAVRKFSVRPKSRFQPTRLQATDSYGGQGTGLQIYIGGKPQLPANTDSLHASGLRLYNIVPAGSEIVFEVTYFSECDWSAVISGSVFDVASDFVRGLFETKPVDTSWRLAAEDTVGDLLPCGPGARDKGFSQMQQMFAAYQGAPVEVQRRWHAQVYGLQTSWNSQVGRLQPGLSWSNCNARDLGAQAEEIRQAIAREVGQRTTVAPSEKSYTQEIAQGLKNEVPWWVWAAGAVAAGAGALYFLGGATKVLGSLR